MYDISLTDLPAQPAVVVRDKVKLEEISKWMGEALGEVAGFLAVLRREPTGPPFTRYFSMNGEFDLEAGFPVRTEVSGVGRTEASELPACRAVMTMHVGPYETLHEAHEALQGWAAGHNYEANGAPWEVYVTDPNEQPDPSTRRTEVVRPYKNN